MSPVSGVLNRGINSLNAKQRQKLQCSGKKFHFSGDFVVSTLHSYASERGVGQGGAQWRPQAGGVVKNWKVYLNFNLFRKRLKSFRY